MAVTVEELLNKVDDWDIKLVAGQAGIQRFVRWLHMVENKETTELNEEQAIAFTTGIGLLEGEDFFGLVKDVYEKDASAMVVNIGPFIESIPNEVIDFCNEKQFPLVEIPWRVHMANIMHCFSELILESDKEKIILENAVKNALFLPKTKEVYLPTLEQYQFKREWSYCIALVELYDRNDQAVQEDAYHHIERILENAMRIRHKNTAIFMINNQLVLFVANRTMRQVKEMMEEMQQKMKTSFLENYQYVWSVGDCVSSVQQIAKSYSKAKSTLKLQKKFREYNKIKYYDDMGIYQILLGVEDPTVLKVYYEKTLKRIEEYDRVNHTDYYHVLSVYLQCQCSVRDTADHLFMHRNSVRYKINKIEEFLHIDLKSQLARTEMMIAFLIKDLN